MTPAPDTPVRVLSHSVIRSRAGDLERQRREFMAQHDDLDSVFDV
jgi:hypothetical protein